MNIEKLNPDTGISKIMSHAESNDIAFISAYLLNDSLAECESRSRFLRDDIRSAGYGYITLKGHWTDENADERQEVEIICVINPTFGSFETFQNIMTGLERKYGQDDVVIKQQGQDPCFDISGTCFGGMNNESDVLKIAGALSGIKNQHLKITSSNCSSYRPATSWAAALRRDYSSERLARGL